MFRELCGDSTLKNVLLVTNMWGEVALDVGEAREEELATEYFKPVLDKGARLARHLNTIGSAHDIIRSIMKNVPIPLQIQRELVDEGKDFANTSAAEAINEELNAQIKKQQAELWALREEMKEIRENDKVARQEMEEERRQRNEEIEKMRKEKESMASGYEEDRRKMKEQMEEMQEQHRKDRERDAEEHRKRMEEYKRLLEERANAAAAEREQLQNRMNELQHQWDNRPQGGCLIM